MAEDNAYPQTKKWLTAELTRRELDVEAYGEYLMSFLAPESSPSEVVPEIVDVLSGVIAEDDAKEFAESLSKEWEKELKGADSQDKVQENEQSKEKGDSLENAILKVIEEEDEKIAQVVKEKEAAEKEKRNDDDDDDNGGEERKEKRELSAKEKAMKAKVLAQYGGIEIDIDLSDKKTEKEYANPNTAAVANEKQKTREQQKAAHEAKQQEIKKSQENQKKTREEKKAKRRAACQKGERRR